MTEILRLLVRDLTGLIVYSLKFLRDSWPMMKFVLVFAAGAIAALLFLHHILMSVFEEEISGGAPTERHPQDGILRRMEKRIALCSLSVSFKTFRYIFDWCRDILEDEEEFKKYDEDL